MNILIRGIDILTGDSGLYVIKNGEIGISGDRITHIAPNGKGPMDFEPDRILSGSGKLAMPGLVNAHTHVGMTAMRNAADDMPLHDWLFNRIFPIEEKMTDDDVYWGTLLGAAEMIRSGTTCYADMYLHMDHAAAAALESGLRANISRSTVDFHSDGGLKAVPAFDLARKYYQEWNGKGNGRLKVYMEVHSTYLFSPDLLSQSAELAKELKTGIHIHLLETVREKMESMEQYGKSPVEICAETGIFDVPVIGAHLVHLTEKDIRLLQQYHVSAAHNPTSNLKLGSGIAPVPSLMKAGVNVALGTDGVASNNNLNLFEEMHLAALIHKGLAQDPELVTAKQAFSMATTNGANALGFGQETGMLRTGMKADIVLLDIDKPHLFPLNDPYSAVVYAAQAGDVDTVIVDGNVLMEAKELKTLDEEKIYARMKEITTRLI